MKRRPDRTDGEGARTRFLFLQGHPHAGQDRAGVLVLTQLMNLVFIGPLAHAGLALSIGLASLRTPASSTADCAASAPTRRRLAGGAGLRDAVCTCSDGLVLYRRLRCRATGCRWARSAVSCTALAVRLALAPISPCCSHWVSGCATFQVARPERGADDEIDE